METWASPIVKVPVKVLFVAAKISICFRTSKPCLFYANQFFFIHTLHDCQYWCYWQADNREMFATMVLLSKNQIEEKCAQ